MTLNALCESYARRGTTDHTYLAAHDAVLRQIVGRIRHPAALKLEEYERQAVDVEDAVGNSQLVFNARHFE